MTELLILDAEAVRRALPMRDCIDAMESAMRIVSRGGALMPLRVIMHVPGSELLFGSMPGCLAEPASCGAKLLTVRPHSSNVASPSHVGVFVLFDASTGRPTAVIDASELTAMRPLLQSPLERLRVPRPETLRFLARENKPSGTSRRWQACAPCVPCGYGGAVTNGQRRSPHEKANAITSGSSPQALRAKPLLGRTSFARRPHPPSPS